MTSENIYSAPKSDLNAVVDKTNEVEVFPRISAWLVFFLAIPTLGIYSKYWLFSRTKLVSSLPNRTMSLTPSAMLLILSIIALLISVLSSIFGKNQIITIISILIAVVNLVLYIVTAFSLRDAVRHILASSGASDSELNGVMTFFFAAIYMQYTINKCIDERNSKLEN